ncbi:MAG: FimB/Mfa2 family fimbrial subunit [Bacteroidales bacterium]|nr:FimB/Mfa2 family fimbrial subunit [Bacteroidales bacterium]
MKRRELILFIVSLLLIGCGVWEDRKNCPQHFALDCSAFKEVAEGVEVWVFRSSGELVQRTSVRRSELSSDITFDVPRDELLCVVWGNVSGMTLLTDSYSRECAILKKDLQSCDSLYSFFTTVTVSKEPVRVEAIPTRQFINFFISFKGIEAEQIAGIYLVGGWNGFSLEGKGYASECKVYGREKTEYRMRITRPFSLEGMRIDYTFILEDGRLLEASLPLGEELTALKYDFMESEPKDVYVVIDAGRAGANIDTEPWNQIPPSHVTW